MASIFNFGKEILDFMINFGRRNPQPAANFIAYEKFPELGEGVYSSAITPGRRCETLIRHLQENFRWFA